MTFMGGLTEVVGVIGRFGDVVVMLDVFCVELVEELGFLEAVILELLFEDLMFEEEMEDLEPEELLLEIWVLVCCCSCCRHFARRFLNQTCRRTERLGLDALLSVIVVL